MAASEALVEIWNGRDQPGTNKIGGVDNCFFNFAKAAWQSSSQSNFESLQSSKNKGDVILVKCPMNRR